MSLSIKRYGCGSLWGEVYTITQLQLSSLANGATRQPPSSTMQPPVTSSATISKKPRKDKSVITFFVFIVEIGGLRIITYARRLEIWFGQHKYVRLGEAVGDSMTQNLDYLSGFIGYARAYPCYTTNPPLVGMVALKIQLKIHDQGTAAWFGAHNTYALLLIDAFHHHGAGLVNFW
ncbi:hypothetical protein Tco_0138794 [Tanacetum coccineum]